ncbi:MAG: 4Fe-4S dicluster domain-containing protein [Clostridiales bacterium]|jgi:heterodisulfide reductase subunit C|nr:4Fe-4S dicluster domain-containing protein [Clostridiales bacterium]
MAIQVNPLFKKEISTLPGGEKLMQCYLCGTCTAGCPVSEIDGEYSPRTIMRLALIGAREELLSSAELWKCSGCHTCVAHCPQDARPADVIRALRSLAVREGYVSPELAARFEAIEEEAKRRRLEDIYAVISDI